VEIIPLDEHHLLIFWVQFVVLVLMARLLGAAMNRIGQPAVVGELAAGLVLGPTVLGALWPSGAEWLSLGTRRSRRCCSSSPGLAS
jgi:K+:H+ antiporter